MRSPSGASAAILRAARQGRATLLVSVALAIEYEAVCCRAEHQAAAGLSDGEVDIFVTAVIAMAEPVETHFLWRPHIRAHCNGMALDTGVKRLGAARGAF